MLRDQILKKEDIIDKPDKSVFNGYAFVRNYSESVTKNGDPFIAGNIECCGTMPFKVWAGGETLDLMRNESFESCICKIHCELNEYAGKQSLIVKEIAKYNGDELVFTDFIIPKYNAEQYYAKLHSILESNCDETTVAIFDRIMEDYKEKFVTEFAAVNNHDACLNGLLAHSTKVCRLTQVYKFYPTLLSSVDINVLYLGAAIHDIGKVLEYRNGTVTPTGQMMSHLTLGMIILQKYEEFICTTKSKKFYADLISIVQQHHNHFGEPPRTLVAYMVHTVDLLDATLTVLEETIEAANSNQIKFDDNKLSFDRQS